MSSVLRMSIVYAGLVVPMRLAGRPVRMLQVYALFAVAYQVLLRSGLVDVVL